MSTWQDASRELHIWIGYLGLIAFWVPILTRKGGALHQRSGTIFRYCGWIVVASALFALMSYLSQLLAQGQGPASQTDNWSFLLFLGYLAIITGMALSHGIAVLKYKRDLRQLASPFRIGLAWLGISSSALLIA